MTRHDLPILGALAVLGMFIWTHDLRWASTLADTWPVLGALPLFWWLRRPWQRKPGVRAPLAPGLALVAVLLLAAGLAADRGSLLAAGWTAMLWSWVSAVFAEPPAGPTRRLILLPLLAFPWLFTDLARATSWLRWSGAAATELVLKWFNVPAEREGALLWCNGLGISTDVTSVGVNGLQLLLVAGIALAFLKLGRLPGFWWHLPVLALAAWAAHFLHILAIALGVIWLEPATAAAWLGPMREVAGWLSLLLVLKLCHGTFEAMARPVAPRVPEAGVSGRRWPVEIVVLFVVLLCTYDLVADWRWTTYSQFGWLAFAAWLLPVWWAVRQPEVDSPHLGFAVGAMLALLVGTALAFNPLRHVALALAVAAFHPLQGRAVWLAAAVAWIPASGALALRLGFTPNQFALTRVVVAALAAGWSLALAMRRRADELADPGMILAVEPKPAP